jgi:hypothetical protein
LTYILWREASSNREARQVIAEFFDAPDIGFSRAPCFNSEFLTRGLSDYLKLLYIITRYATLQTAWNAQDILDVDPAPAGREDTGQDKKAHAK